MLYSVDCECNWFINSKVVDRKPSVWRQRRRRNRRRRRGRIHDPYVSAILRSRHKMHAVLLKMNVSYMQHSKRWQLHISCNPFCEILLFYLNAFNKAVGLISLSSDLRNPEDKHINEPMSYDSRKCSMCDQQRIRPACAYAQSDKSLASRLNILWMLSCWLNSLWSF